MFVLDRGHMLAVLGKKEGKAHFDKAEEGIHAEHDSIRTIRSPAVQAL